MPHPYEYPEKTIIPHEGDMEVEIVDWPRSYPADREGVQGVGPFIQSTSPEALRGWGDKRDETVLGGLINTEAATLPKDTES